ncbi:unnamed protein product [Kuraishia capsulata CBS 1993]|uniref:Uncharacterized protein n=1 Tax=Kuraishia capsulata CBS 1993 TaxID=1382522 RepID=W6MGU0_9ASCO|nr:uncharacterized protein KUCA_T00001048001 [Kuraishia capsulata CBS 1993]CDK25081.1 unnamed protein product [Kuraishia capsulata CBS 1993]
MCQLCSPHVRCSSYMNPRSAPQTRDSVLKSHIISVSWGLYRVIVTFFQASSPTLLSVHTVLTINSMPHSEIVTYVNGSAQLCVAGSVYFLVVTMHPYVYRMS